VLSAVTAPTLVVAQEQDPLHCVDLATDLATVLPHATLLTLPPGGVFWTASAQASAALAAHLAEDSS
jgi:pimeloyl-ACP methyl ester carboxylesterase